MKIRIVYRYTGKAETHWDDLPSGKTQLWPGHFISYADYDVLPEEVTIRQEIRV